jgi:hypothetical protein
LILSLTTAQAGFFKRKLKTEKIKRKPRPQARGLRRQGCVTVSNKTMHPLAMTFSFFDKRQSLRPFNFLNGTRNLSRQPFLLMSILKLSQHALQEIFIVKYSSSKGDFAIFTQHFLLLFQSIFSVHRRAYSYKSRAFSFL